MPVFKPRAQKLYERGDVDGLVEELDAPLESQRQLEASRALILMGDRAALPLLVVLTESNFVYSSQNRMARATLVQIGQPALEKTLVLIQLVKNPEGVREFAVLAQMIASYHRLVVPQEYRDVVEAKTGLSWAEIEELEEAYEP